VSSPTRKPSRVTDAILSDADNFSLPFILKLASLGAIEERFAFSLDPKLSTYQEPRLVRDAKSAEVNIEVY
jgi:hypothetical protein